MVSVVWKGEGDVTVKAQSPDRTQMPRPKGGIAHGSHTRAQAEAKSSTWPRCAESVHGVCTGCGFHQEGEES